MYNQPFQTQNKSKTVDRVYNVGNPLEYFNIDKQRQQFPQGPQSPKNDQIRLQNIKILNQQTQLPPSSQPNKNTSQINQQTQVGPNIQENKYTNQNYTNKNWQNQTNAIVNQPQQFQFTPQDHRNDYMREQNTNAFNQQTQQRPNIQENKNTNQNQTNQNGRNQTNAIANQFQQFQFTPQDQRNDYMREQNAKAFNQQTQQRPNSQENKNTNQNQTNQNYINQNLQNQTNPIVNQPQQFQVTPQDQRNDQLREQNSKSFNQQTQQRPNSQENKNNNQKQIKLLRPDSLENKTNQHSSNQNLQNQTNAIGNYTKQFQINQPFQKNLQFAADPNPMTSSKIQIKNKVQNTFQQLREKGPVKPQQLNQQQTPVESPLKQNSSNNQSQLMQSSEVRKNKFDREEDSTNKEVRSSIGQHVQSRIQTAITNSDEKKTSDEKKQNLNGLPETGQFQGNSSEVIKTSGQNRFQTQNQPNDQQVKNRYSTQPKNRNQNAGKIQNKQLPSCYECLKQITNLNLSYQMKCCIGIYHSSCFKAFFMKKINSGQTSFKCPCSVKVKLYSIKSVINDFEYKQILGKHLKQQIQNIRQKNQKYKFVQCSNFDCGFFWISFEQINKQNFCPSCQIKEVDSSQNNFQYSGENLVIEQKQFNKINENNREPQKEIARPIQLNSDKVQEKDIRQNSIQKQDQATNQKNLLICRKRPQTQEKKATNKIIKSRQKQYQVVKEILSETKLSIFLVKNLSDNKQYTMKVIPKTDQEEKMFAERAILKLENSIYSAKYYEVFEDAQDFINLYITMEYCEGSSIYNEIYNEEKKFSEEEVIHIGKQIALGIKELHAVFMIHRSITPKNIVWTLIKNSSPTKANNQEKVYKICDLGYSKQISTRSDIKAFPNEILSYMAPEMIGSNQFDEKVDVWALGCILYEMLFGYSLFLDQTQNQIFDNIKKINSYEFKKRFKVCKNEQLKYIFQNIFTDRIQRISINEVLQKLVEATKKGSEKSQTGIQTIQSEIRPQNPQQPQTQNNIPYTYGQKSQIPYSLDKSKPQTQTQQQQSNKGNYNNQQQWEQTLQKPTVEEKKISRTGLLQQQVEINQNQQKQNQQFNYYYNN